MRFKGINKRFRVLSSRVCFGDVFFSGIVGIYVYGIIEVVLFFGRLLYELDF